MIDRARSPGKSSLPLFRPAAYRPPPSARSRTERTRPATPGTPIGRMSLELARLCNLKCTYCYTEATATHRGGLTDEEIRAVVAEAVNLGARLVSIVGGGEPLMRDSLLRDGESIIDYANSLGCYTYLYTNCTLIRDEQARWLFARDVSIVGKLNSLREDVQDALVGVKGSGRRIRRGIDALIEAGFTADTPSRLSLETIICPQNYDELPEMWRWMRQRNIVPEVEIPTFHGRASQNQDSLTFDEREAPQKYADLFHELLRIDRAEFGYDWIPHPPFPAGDCKLFENNCYVNDRGGVQPCAGVDRQYGTLGLGRPDRAPRSLGDIVTSPDFMDVRNVRTKVEEPCRSCDLKDQCYGCRGAAYQATGDPWAADPVCWYGRDIRPVPSCEGCAG